MRRRALLLWWAAALAALLAPHGAGGDEVVPTFVDERAASHVPHGHVEWNYTLTPHMLARSIGYRVRRCRVRRCRRAAVSRLRPRLTRHAGEL